MTMPNKSLLAKSNARLAASQLLYSVTITQETWEPSILADRYKDYFDKPLTIPPHRPLLVALLEGVKTHGDDLEPQLDNILDHNWNKNRMSPLLLAILRLGLFELSHYPERDQTIIISEYVSVTDRFFDEAETKFVNAALEKLAKKVRMSP